MVHKWVSLSRVSLEGACSFFPDDPLIFVSVASEALPPFKTGLFKVRCEILKLHQQPHTVRLQGSTHFSDLVNVLNADLLAQDQCCLQCWSCSYICLVWLTDKTNRGLSLCQLKGLAETTNSFLSTDQESLGVFWSWTSEYLQWET